MIRIAEPEEKRFKLEPPISKIRFLLTSQFDFVSRDCDVSSASIFCLAGPGIPKRPSRARQT